MKRSQEGNAKKIGISNRSFSTKKILFELRRSWHLILLTLAFSVLIVLVFAFTREKVKNNLEESLEQSLNTILETTQNTILTWMSDMELDIDRFVHHPDFQNNIQAPILNNKDSFPHKWQQNIPPRKNYLKSRFTERAKRVLLN